MMKIKLLSAVRFIFITMITLILCAGLFRTLFIPKDVNYYENRKANKMPAFTLSVFLSSDFQNGADAAFSDQIFKAERAKEIYNNLETNFTLGIMMNIYKANPDIYLKFNNLHVFGGDYLVYSTRYPDAVSEDMSARAENINAVTKGHPDLTFYTYYIEKETDISFQGNNKTGIYEYFESLIDTKNNKLARFSIDSFEMFSEFFYKTDHHWNHKGSYKAYTELVSFLDAGAPMARGEEFLVGTGMSGSKAAQSKAFGIWTEDMYAYKYGFPQMSITVNGEDSAEYGAQNTVLDAPAYGHYYGTDSGEVIFDTGDTNKKNLLVIGESYDNAILKLLATHFNRTHSIDLRYYEHYMGKKFSFDDYVTENDITEVLFIGNLDFYRLNDFTVE